MNNQDPAEIQRNMFRENRHAKQKSKITFYGGPADGEVFDIPNGVNELMVDTPFGKVRYIRSLEKSNQFIHAIIQPNEH